jgi:hypothetical protein
LRRERKNVVRKTFEKSGQLLEEKSG